MNTLEAWATSLNDAALADRLTRLAKDIRFYTPGERVALLQEAARRLTPKEQS